MLKTMEDISATKKRLSIEIPPEAFEDEIRSTLKDIRQRSKLPGFRPGKAPFSLIEKRFGKDVEGEVMEKIIPKYYSDALKEAEIVPVGQPELEGGLDFKRNTPLALTFTVEVRPKVENLSYDGIEVEGLPIGITDADVETTLKRLQQDKATFEPTDGPAQEDDLMVLDYSLLGGEEFKDQVFRVGSETMPKYFSQKVTGLKKGDTAAFELTFPEDYYNKDVAGKSYTTNVTVKEVKKVILPELDEEFAKDMEMDDLQALKDHIRERLAESQRDQADNILKGQIMNKLLETYQFEAPESLLNLELDHALTQAKAQAQGGEVDEEKMKEELQAPSERNVRASMLMQMIGEKENVQVTEDDLKNRLVGLSAKFGLSPENMMKYFVSRDGSLDGLRNSVYEEKVLALLLERANVKPAPEAEKAAAE
jgi:trigger factor